MLRQVISKIYKKVLYRYQSDSDTYIKWLRKKGCEIGEGTVFFTPAQCMIDVTRPWLISIGKNVQFASGNTMILTHGYDWSVLKAVYGDVLGSAGGVSIGDNVFIGANVTILKGVHIGNNVIIGACSLVNKDIPDNCVAVGTPCHPIMSLDDYYKKRKSLQLKEAKECVQLYRKRYSSEPNDKVLHEFFWLFSDGDSQLTQKWKHMMKLMNNEDLSYKQLAKNIKQFENMDDFLNKI